MSNKHLEVEFKYSAEDISLNHFNKFCEATREHETYRANLGLDKFFTNPDRPDTFFRLREDDDKIQVTFKRKTQDDNSVRIEYNLSIGNDHKTAYALIEELGYKYDAQLVKVNHVHVFPWYVMSYYICYNDNMTETGRFIEIEMREDKTWSTEYEIFNELRIIEKMCKSLGLSPDKRLKQSLYEMYRSQS